MIVLRRSPFKRPVPPASLARVRQWEGGEITPRHPVSVPVVRSMVLSLAKDGALQHLGYQSIVRGLPCARCGYSATRNQFCHADFSKGAGLKTDCRLGWPGCGPHDDGPGCHWIVGTSGRLGKQGRRDFEERAGRETRELVLAAGLWPARLPRWIE